MRKIKDGVAYHIRPWRDLIPGYMLGKRQRKECDYLSDEELDGSSFVRVGRDKQMIPLCEFAAIREDPLGFQGQHSLTAWSCYRVKISHCGERYQIAYCYYVGGEE